jgi:hypothetical protein
MRRVRSSEKDDKMDKLIVIQIPLTLEITILLCNRNGVDFLAAKVPNLLLNILSFVYVFVTKKNFIE